LAAPKAVSPLLPAHGFGVHRQLFPAGNCQRHKIENMFGKIKDWRRIHTRYDRCARTFMCAICIAVAVIFWL
jgi:transposase